jgi:hypothetical protein
MILELIGKIITPKSRKIKEEKKMLSVLLLFVVLSVVREVLMLSAKL